MIVFDASFLIDYLNAEPAAQEFLEENETKPFFAPTLALFEAYRGGARTTGRDGVETVSRALEWVEPLPVTAGAAREAAVIEAELLEAGAPINLGDVLIAGVCRNAGGRLVTQDTHFQSVDGLDTVTY